MAGEQTAKTYDSYIKEFIGKSSDKNVIRFINALFGENIPADSEVIRLETETANQGEPRRSDFMIMIDRRVFHIEVQSSDNDEDMIFRMFEYGVRSAFTRRETESGRMTLRFPDPVIIYLRSTDKTPAKFFVDLVFSNDKTFTQEINIKRLRDYTLDELFESKLYALTLFYPMNFESTLCKKHTAEDETRFTDGILSVLDRVDSEKEKGEISAVESDLILDGVEDIAQRIISKTEIMNRGEVDRFMENVQKKYAFRILNEMEAAEVKGDNKRQIETARRMKKKNYPVEDIRDLTDLPVETIRAL